jgi:hypothetical protein
VEQLELLLDAQAEGRALAEVDLYAAKAPLAVPRQDAGLCPVSV